MTQDSSSEKPAEAPSPNTLAPISPEEARCNRETDKIFNQKYPERQGKPLEAGEEELAQEWLEIRSSIEGCKELNSDLEKDRNNSLKVEVSPQEEPQGEKTDSLISSDLIESAKKVGVPIILPSYIPAGFKITQFEHKLTGEPYNNSHTTSYQGPNGCSFSIGGADGGWGAVSPVRTWIVNSKLLGEVILEEDESFDTSPNDLGASITPSWDDEGKVLSGSGPLASEGFPDAGYSFDFSCENSLFSPEEAIKIIESVELY